MEPAFEDGRSTGDGYQFGVPSGRSLSPYSAVRRLLFPDPFGRRLERAMMPVGASKRRSSDQVSVRLRA